jgi:hypothetical protein
MRKNDLVASPALRERKILGKKIRDYQNNPENTEDK